MSQIAAEIPKWNNLGPRIVFRTTLCPREDGRSWFERAESPGPDIHFLSASFWTQGATTMSGSTESQGRFLSMGQFAGRGPQRGTSVFLRQSCFIVGGSVRG